MSRADEEDPPISVAFIAEKVFGHRITGGSEEQQLAELLYQYEKKTRERRHSTALTVALALDVPREHAERLARVVARTNDFTKIQKFVKELPL